MDILSTRILQNQLQDDFAWTLMEYSKKQQLHLPEPFSSDQ